MKLAKKCLFSVTSVVVLVTQVALVAGQSHRRRGKQQANLNDERRQEEEILELRKLFNVYSKWKEFIRPQAATMQGKKGDYTKRLDEVSIEDLTKRRNITQHFLDEAETFNLPISPRLDRVSLLVLKNELQNFIKHFDSQQFVFSVSQIANYHQLFRETVATALLDEEQDYWNLLIRYRSFPKQLEDLTQLLRIGIERNLTEHRIAIDYVIAQLDAMKKPADESNEFFRIFLNITTTNGNTNNSIPEEQKVKLREAAVEAITESINPALENFKAFLVQEYLPACRPEIALSSLEGGRERYQVVQDLGFGNITVSAFSEILRNDPKNFFDNSSELLESFRRITFEEIEPRLPQLFQTIPKQNVSITMNPTPGGYMIRYSAGNAVRPGLLIINESRFKFMSRFGMKTMALHEGNPGHHFHFALNQELPVPSFRLSYSPDTSFAPAASLVAFTEGWGLYAESLGEDLGIYESDPLGRFGRLSAEQHRAVRLVVDTGIHALGWSRDRAISFMLDHLAMAKANIKVELDRHIGLPGQACSYKIGEMKIQELRRKSQKILGDQFNIKHFHSIVLQCFAPLDVLTECIEQYLKQRVSEIIRGKESDT
ncbi:unnamed protein product [Cyprideis torosa]|uniref:Uncharacterized protein n=1 Tax=Cyprideis torosa TaxID=163714 RepID=A0A7R8ZM16_9CRUS|nr:unnamed protein product [Cyprideis torosa]CAG0884853.1 unnamed protein product [Cyprideis torosa]